VKGYSDPLLLEPLKTVKIESDRMSTDPFEKSRLFDKNIKLRVYCSGGKVLTVKYKRLKKQWKKPKEYRPKMVINQHFGDVLVTEHMKYVVYIISPEEKTTSTFINKAGFIRDSIKGFNGIPKEIVDDPEKVVEALEGLLGDGYKVVLKDIALFFSDEEETDED